MQRNAMHTTNAVLFVSHPSKVRIAPFTKTMLYVYSEILKLRRGLHQRSLSHHKKILYNETFQLRFPFPSHQWILRYTKILGRIKNPCYEDSLYRNGVFYQTLVSILVRSPEGERTRKN